ncbi:hypothetical protein [uncultured Dubosiella sp.]|uniref:hypothetical protein n=1 Tax=uncultured Dubosiella sp. TaxID=1937011 RepID=UPI002598C66E|nr:hypothetical protein [uncultured Dubosiella sp.]
MVKEEKQSIKDNSKDNTKKEPIIIYKFCEKKQYADDILNGKFYLNDIKHFRKLEKEKGKKDKEMPRKRYGRKWIMMKKFLYVAFLAFLQMN